MKNTFLKIYLSQILGKLTIIRIKKKKYFEEYYKILLKKTRNNKQVEFLF
jgi:hypothetical protein